MTNSLSTTNKELILIAPNAFKGSLKAEDFCRILTDELSARHHSVVSLPMCDGGDGTAPIIAAYFHAHPVEIESVDALNRKKHVTYYTDGVHGIVDLASICGLQDLSPEEYDVFNANTEGLGKVLLHMVRQGIRQILLGVGGSASIDGGLGALQAMGLKIVKSGHTYKNHIIEIEEIDAVNINKEFKDVEFTILCDVENPLCGLTGAASVFGAQKGATSLQVSILDEKLQDYAALLLSTTGRDILSLKHGGAAGGITAAFHSLFKVRLISGADYCLELSGFNTLLSRSKLVITGEGRLDSQSLSGKLPGVIASLCNKAHVPVIAIAGSTEAYFPEFARIHTLDRYAPTLSASLNNPVYYLKLLAKELNI